MEVLSLVSLAVVEEDAGTLFGPWARDVEGGREGEEGLSSIVSLCG